MTRFLLDANISPKVAVVLKDTLHLDVESLLSPGLGSIPDEEVAETAMAEGRVIITFDKGFGEMYFFSGRGRLGVIALRLSDQRTESVIDVLTRFFTTSAQRIDLETSLVIVEDDRVRIVRHT